MRVTDCDFRCSLRAVVPLSCPAGGAGGGAAAGTEGDGGVSGQRSDSSPVTLNKPPWAPVSLSAQTLEHAVQDSIYRVSNGWCCVGTRRFGEIFRSLPFLHHVFPVVHRPLAQAYERHLRLSGVEGGGACHSGCSPGLDECVATSPANWLSCHPTPTPSTLSGRAFGS